jgi:hypothetical protein
MAQISHLNMNEACPQIPAQTDSFNRFQQHSFKKDRKAAMAADDSTSAMLSSPPPSPSPGSPKPLDLAAASTRDRFYETPFRPKNIWTNFHPPVMDKVPYK